MFKRALSILLSVCASFILTHAQQKDLTIITSSPRGVISSIDQGRTIFVNFSDPMTALQAIPTDEGTGPLIIEPKIKGKFRWAGTGTLSFIPDQNLPYSTSFTMKVPAGTSSLNGSMLRKDFTWSFETPRPAIIWTSPWRNQEHVDPRTSILLRFNQPVDAQVVAKNISLRLKNNFGVDSYPSFTVRQAALADSIKNPQEVIIIKPNGDFGLGAAVSIVLKEGVRGLEGPLTMPSSYTLDFTTYGELKFLGIEKTDEIYPQTGITLLFSNAVTSKDVMAHLTFKPNLTSREEYYENNYPSKRIYLPLPFQPDSSYTGILKSGLTDKFGNVLNSENTFSLTVQSYLPFVRTRTGIGVLEGYESHKFPVTTMNMDSFRVQMGAVDPDRIVPLMRKFSGDTYDQLAVEEGVLLNSSSLSEDAKEYSRAKVIPTRTKRNTVTVRPVDFDEVLGKNGRGVVFVQVDDMNPEKTAYLKTLVQVTNFGITAKFSPESNLIWVTNLKDASPVSNAHVEIRNDSNSVVWSSMTDDKGFAETPGWGKLKYNAQTQTEGDEESEDYGATSQPHQWVIVNKGNEIAFTSSDWNEGIQPYRFDLPYDWNPQPQKFEGVLFTDRGLYKANETVDIKGIVRSRTESTWKLATGLKTCLIIKNSRNEEIYNQEQKLSPFGTFTASVPLKPNAPLGNYSMLLNYAANNDGKEQWKRIEHGSFRVEAFRPAEFEVIAKYDKDQYIMGDTLSGFLNAKYLFGAPMKDEEVKWHISASRGHFTPAGYDSYFFGKLGWLSRYQNDFSGKEVQNQDTSLDEYGSILVKSPVHVGEFEGTVSFMLEGEVTSPSRQTLAGRTSVLMHGGEYYIGVRPSSTFVKSDTAMTFSFVAAASSGKLIENQSLSVHIYQRIWHSVQRQRRAVDMLGIRRRLIR